MWDFIITITNNLGMNLEGILLLVVMLMSVIAYAKDVRLGLLMGMILTGILFIIFYEFELDYSAALIMFFIHFAVLALTILSMGRQSSNSEVS